MNPYEACRTINRQHSVGRITFPYLTERKIFRCSFRLRVLADTLRVRPHLWTQA